MSTFGDLENLLRYGFSASQLAGAIDSLYFKGEINKLPSAEAEKKWEFLIQAYRSGADGKGIDPEDAIAAINFDLSISPYLGTPLDKKKGFYEWCLKSAIIGKV